MIKTEKKVLDSYIFMCCNWKWHVGEIVAEKGHFWHIYVKYWVRKIVRVNTHGKKYDDSEDNYKKIILRRDLLILERLKSILNNYK